MAFTAARMIARNFGSAERVIETIEMLRDQLGINHYIGWLRIPSLDRAAALRSMEEFADKVIPHFRAQDRAAGRVPTAEAVLG